MTETQQQPIFLTLQLNLAQIDFIQNALGKLPTESGAWQVQQIINSQAVPQLEELQAQNTEVADTVDAPDTTSEIPTTVQ